MTIDKSGEWWKGSAPPDLDEYLADYTEGSYPADRFEHARCACTCARFRLEVDDEAGCARRSCVACDKQHLMLDSGDHWSEATPEECACPCGGEVFELAVAFSHRADRSIRWVTIGARCVACGVLGAYSDWKIDYEPADHLYTSV